MNVFPRVLPGPRLGFNLVRVPNAVYVVTTTSRGYLSEMGFFTRTICTVIIICAAIPLLLLAFSLWIAWLVFWYTMVLFWKALVWVYRRIRDNW